MFNKLNAHERMQADITNLKKVMNDTLALVLEIHSGMQEMQEYVVKPAKEKDRIDWGEPAEKPAEKEPIVEPEPEQESGKRSHKVPPLTGKEAAAKANAKLGYKFYAERSGKINTISPWTVFKVEGLVIYDNHKHKLTEEGMKPENARLFAYKCAPDGHKDLCIAPIAGPQALVSWASKHQEFRRKN